MQKFSRKYQQIKLKYILKGSLTMINWDLFREYKDSLLYAD